MARFVVDASVAAKWSLPEEHSGAARALLFEQHELIAPDFISIELAQVMLKTARRGEIARADALSALTRVHELLRIRASSGLAFPAFELATSLGTSVYDALYLALALREECALITADRRLFEAVQPHFPTAAAWIGDLASEDAR